MNLLILVFIVLVQLVFQSLFFEKYYILKKEKQIKNEIQGFKEYLNKEITLGVATPRKVMNYIQEVKKTTGIELSYRYSNLYDGIFIESYMSNEYIPIIDKKSKNEYKIVLGDFFPYLKVNKDDSIEVQGTVDNYGYIIPYSLFINGVEIESIYSLKSSLLISGNNVNAAETIRAGAFFTEVDFQGTSLGSVEKNEELSAISYLDFYSSPEVINNIIYSSAYTDTIKNGSNTGDLIISSLQFNGAYLLGVSPLSAVSDIINTMDSYYLFVFGVALIFVSVVSLVYSKFITKPLIHMSNVAKEISKSNFNVKYPVKTNDEIGVLGESLNSIAYNLRKTLKDLKVSNKKLQEEMNMQKVHEDRRKELVANISHELKTPITIIQGSIEGLQRGIYSDDIYKDILEETTRMNDLVMEMLEVSKLDTPNFKLNIDVFDLYNLVLKEIDKLKTLINEKSISISLELKIKTEEDELFVYGDEKRIEEVLRNLMTNAIKYTYEGENIKVIIKEYNNKYKFVIENFGVILTEEELNSIWEPFYRKEKSRNKKFGGTGLGLYIVKRILELHESKYSLSSTNNSVVFSFTLNKVEI